MSSDNVIYFDNSATSWPKPRETGEAMMYYLNDVGANPGRSGHSRSVEAGQIVLNARENLCRLFNVKLPQQIAFTKNITESLNCVFYTMLKGGIAPALWAESTTIMMSSFFALTARLMAAIS